MRLEIEVVDPNDGNWRRDIVDLSMVLRNAEIGLSQRMFVKDATGGGMEQLAEMSVRIGVPLITAFGAWFAGRASRKVRLKIGDVEAEAGSIKEVKQLLTLAGYDFDDKPEVEK